MEITIDGSELEDLFPPEQAAAMMAMLEVATAKAGADVVAGAMARSRVGETGNMRAGWQAGDVEVGGGGMFVIISNGVEYAVFHEFGTWKMTAQPMAIPSLEEVAPGYEAAVDAIVSSLGTGLGVTGVSVSRTRNHKGRFVK